MPGPVQPTYNTATWSFQVADRTLTSTAFLTPHPEVVRYTRRDSDYCEIALQIKNQDDLNALEAAVHTKVLRAWRNGVNRFNGEFTEVRETADYWELVAKDPFYNMSWRQVRADVTYTAVDAGTIAWNLINLQNGYVNSHLRQGARDASVNRTIPYLVGQRVSEAVQDLTRMSPNGFSFTIDGVDNPTYWAEIVVHYPVGELKPKARFEFGNGTLENCDDFLRESLPLVNRSQVVGKVATVVGISESGSSPALHGLWEGDRGQVMTENTTQLGLIAAGNISNAPQYSITLVAGAEAPQLFTDFDVGNTVPMVIRRAGRTITGNKRVKEATVLLDPNSGAEQLESLEVYE